MVDTDIHHLFFLFVPYTLISNGIDAGVGLLRACHPERVLLCVEYEVPNEARWVAPKWGR
jgi:hypothetical protein